MSGSQAQQFFDRTYYAKSDMDIYAYHSEVHRISMWLITQGYSRSTGFTRGDFSRRCYVASEGSERTVYPLTSMSVLINHDKYEELWDGTKRKLRIQLIGLDVDPVHHILYGFHSSGYFRIFSLEGF